jgi:hypothetical protein
MFGEHWVFGEHWAIAQSELICDRAGPALGSAHQRAELGALVCPTLRQPRPRRPLRPLLPPQLELFVSFANELPDPSGSRILRPLFLTLLRGQRPRHRSVSSACHRVPVLRLPLRIDHHPRPDPLDRHGRRLKLPITFRHGRKMNSLGDPPAASGTPAHPGASRPDSTCISSSRRA